MCLIDVIYWKEIPTFKPLKSSLVHTIQFHSKWSISLDLKGFVEFLSISTGPSRYNSLFDTHSYTHILLGFVFANL